jgi:hypothetical protein
VSGRRGGFAPPELGWGVAGEDSATMRVSLTSGGGRDSQRVGALLAKRGGAQLRALHPASVTPRPSRAVASVRPATGHGTGRTPVPHSTPVEDRSSTDVQMTLAGGGQVVHGCPDHPCRWGWRRCRRRLHVGEAGAAVVSCRACGQRSGSVGRRPQVESRASRSAARPPLEPRRPRVVRSLLRTPDDCTGGLSASATGERSGSGRQGQEPQQRPLLLQAPLRPGSGRPSEVVTSGCTGRMLPP